MNHLLKNLSIDALTPMQEDACAAIGTGHDVVLLAPTGSGKTLAYLLPLAVRQPAIPFLVICPTRELAQQSCAVWKQMRTGIPAMSLHGGRPAMDEHRLLRAIQPRALFATPGRFNDHLDKGNINPSALQNIVIDEFDKCLELGFQEAMQRILERLQDSTRPSYFLLPMRQPFPTSCQRVQPMPCDLTSSPEPPNFARA